MEPERQRHTGIPASTSNRVGAIADFNQGVARSTIGGVRSSSNITALPKASA